MINPSLKTKRGYFIIPALIFSCLMFADAIAPVAPLISTSAEAAPFRLKTRPCTVRCEDVFRSRPNCRNSTSDLCDITYRNEYRGCLNRCSASAADMKRRLDEVKRRRGQI
jgi:hypothetical protein